MAASYPGAIKSFSAITTGTVLTALLFTEAADEIAAIETELGLSPHGLAGSIAERILNFCDGNGGMLGHLKQAEGASDSTRQRIRAGQVEVLVSDMATSQAKWKEDTLTFSPPLAALPNVCHASVQLEYTEADRGADDSPIMVSYVFNSGTTTSFRYRVTSSLNAPPDPDTKFILHWLAWERTSNADSGY